MTADRLTPSHDLLLQEYVLVQAWEKTASYIRAHNWYADTLDLDRTAVNLPRFLAELAEQLKAPDQWQAKDHSYRASGGSCRRRTYRIRTQAEGISAVRPGESADIPDSNDPD